VAQIEEHKEPDMAETKYCEDCKHFHPGDEVKGTDRYLRNALCTYDYGLPPSGIELVGRFPREIPRCFDMRLHAIGRAAYCGPMALKFEPKVSVPAHGPIAED
jgi:hypothetical protein